MSNIAFIAARMGSERLYGKVLKKLAGIPSLVHIFKILEAAKSIDGFAVLTTTSGEDDIIEEVCKKESVKIFRGSVNNVLDRFRVAALELKPDRIVRVTGDDPLMDPEIIDKVVNEHCEGNFDYTSNMVDRTYPRGMDTEVIEYKALEKSWKETSDADDLEHVTLYIRRHPEMFRIHSVKSAGESVADLRLCLDTEEDYKLLTEIYDNLYDGARIRLKDVLEFLKKNPSLRKINSGVKQKLVKGKIY